MGEHFQRGGLCFASSYSQFRPIEIAHPPKFGSPTTPRSAGPKLEPDASTSEGVMNFDVRSSVRQLCALRPYAADHSQHGAAGLWRLNIHLSPQGEMLADLITVASVKT